MRLYYISQRIRALSLQERTATHSDEIDYAHAQAVSPEISFLLDLLTSGFLHGTFDSDVITASLYELVARRRARHEHGTAVDDEADILYDIMTQADVRDHGYLPRERVGALMHALDTSQLLCELVFIPIPTRQYLTAPGVLSVLSDESAVGDSNEASSSMYLLQLSCVRVWDIVGYLSFEHKKCFVFSDLSVREKAWRGKRSL